MNGFHLTAGDKDYKERLEQIEEGVKEYYNANGIPSGEPTMKGSNADPYVADVALPNAELGDYTVPTDWPTNVKFNEPGDVPGPVVQFEDDDQGDIKAGYGFESDNLYEGDWFFSTLAIPAQSRTRTAVNVCLFVCYTPYGEAIVDEHLTTYENPFKFSGKELDDITGLYDHGARSRNPVSTLWYGVDPLWEKYPDFSPYNYCAGNPVKYVDPDGRKLKIDGDAKDEALSQIQCKVNGKRRGITLYFKEDGSVAYKQNGKRLSRRAQRVVNILNDEKITVHMTATKDYLDSDGGLLVGGAFMGNQITRKNVNGKWGEISQVDTYQEINPEILEKMDNGDTGKGIMHELTESYEGGLISYKTNTNALKASATNQIYQEAHGKASPQPKFFEEYYNSQGQVVGRYNNPTAVRVYLEGAGGWNNPILYYDANENK